MVSDEHYASEAARISGREMPHDHRIARRSRGGRLLESVASSSRLHAAACWLAPRAAVISLPGAAEARVSAAVADRRSNSY